MSKKAKIPNLIRRADGSYSRHGLWDSIRANAGSGKKPTEAMLKQERKIKSMQGGGRTGEEIECRKCHWHWNTNDSDMGDKYICHKCGYDNSNNYEQMNTLGYYKKGGKIDRLPSTDPSTWDAKYNVGDKVKIRFDYSLGNNTYTIKGFQDALGDYNEAGGSGAQRPENPSGRLYFLSDGGGSWEGKDLEPADQNTETNATLEAADKKPSLISVVNEENDYGFTTPTGEKTRLTYLQQVLVRTKGFKDFFGDWEAAAKAFISDNRRNFEVHYKNVSKILDTVTLEPRLVYHGTRTQDEFYRFDVTKEKGVGRPYGYFAVNREYSQRFTQSSQRNTRESQPFLYSCFLNVRNPFRANASEYWQKQRDADGWLECITGTICWDKYKTVEKNSVTKDLAKAIESQIKKYLEERFPVKAPFWYAMAGDIEKDFKYFLMAYGYDGISYGEEISLGYDADDPSQYTEAVTIFDSKQVKLGDGRNLNFNPLVDDIRYKQGGEVEHSKEDNHEEQYKYDGFMNKKAKLGMLINGNKYAQGGKIVHEGGSTNDGKKGGYFDGRSHAEGGIKAINVDTGQLLEVEGEEVIITKGAVNDETKREFEGEMLTNKQILSKINQSGGGVSFEDGGKVGGHVCGCSGKKYKFGGEMLEDFDIIRNMSKPTKFVNDMLASPKRFADFLVEKMK